MPQIHAILILLWLFQSAPGREAGRCNPNCITSPSVLRFQSAPGREAGRCLTDKTSGTIRFKVSIRARP